jgi:hypothetical protein
MGEVTKLVLDEPARSRREEGEAGSVSARRGERGPSGFLDLLDEGVPGDEASAASTTVVVDGSPSVELRRAERTSGESGSSTSRGSLSCVMVV